MKTKIFAALACALAIPAAAFAAHPTNVVFAAEATPQRVEMLIDEYYLSDLEAVKNRTAGSTGELVMAQKLSGFMGAMNFDYFAAQTSYLQSFDISKTHTSQNVVGVLDNGAENYVILGAHYDCIYKDKQRYFFNYFKCRTSSVNTYIAKLPTVTCCRKYKCSFLCIDV